MQKTREKIDKLRAEERRLKTRLGREYRRQDTRRKILIGSWLLAQEGSDLPTLGERMDGWLIRQADRQLFGLPPLSDTEKKECTYE